MVVGNSVSLILALVCFYLLFTFCLFPTVEASSYDQAGPLDTLYRGMNGILDNPFLKTGFDNFLKPQPGLVKMQESWEGRRILPKHISTTQRMADGNPESSASRWFPKTSTSASHSATDQFFLEHHHRTDAPTVDNIFNSSDSQYNSSITDSWTGRWLPESLPTSSPSIFNNEQLLTEQHHQTPTPFVDDIFDSSDSQDNSSIIESWTGRWFPESLPTSLPSTSGRPNLLPQGSDIFYSISPVLKNTSLMSREEEQESWTGRWLPERTTSRPRVEQPVLENRLSAPYSMWQMINSSCDDGKTNLTVDWDGSPVNYTCFNPHKYFEPDFDLPNLIIKSAIPKAYKAKHECMRRQIEYPTDLPTFGTHRPAWPRYGEYRFLPRQRWLHSLEHGAVVMLYHPCAHPALVNELKRIVNSCLYRHIITPYTLLPPDRPMALLTWGWALLLTSPDKHGVTNFIRQRALRGPEATSKDGQFSEGLIKPAVVITDQNDTTDIGLCPQTLF